MFDNAYAIIVSDQDGDISDMVYSPTIMTTFSITIYISYPLILTMFIGWVLLMVNRRKPFLPRKPLTISSTILYLCNSTQLLGDFANTSDLTSRQREASVRRIGRKYAFG
jgi:hypothetical protein